MRTAVSALLLALVAAGQVLSGEKTMTDKTPRKSDNNIITKCDRFILSATLNGNTLEVSLDTDLPDEVDLSVTVQRCYLQLEKDTEYSREYFSVQSNISEWRKKRSIPIDDSAWLEDLKKHQDEMAALGKNFAFAVGSIDKNIELRMVVPVQDRFGEWNKNLTGNAVSIKNELRIVEAKKIFSRPLAGGTINPSSIAAYNSLEAGKTYRITGGFPLMPKHPDDLSRSTHETMGETYSAKKVTTESASILVLVREVRPSGNTPWYRVDIPGHSGWVNSIALMKTKISTE